MSSGTGCWMSSILLSHFAVASVDPKSPHETPRPDGGAMNSDERAHPSGAKGAYRAMVEFATASSLVRTSERGSSGADVPSPSPNRGRKLPVGQNRTEIPAC